MTTRTNFQMIYSFKEYAPAQRGFTSSEEIAEIADHFDLDKMSVLDMQNLRDMVVLLYREWSRSARENSNWDEFDRLTDAMQSITTVIDHYKYNA